MWVLRVHIDTPRNSTRLAGPWPEHTPPAPTESSATPLLPTHTSELSHPTSRNTHAPEVAGPRPDALVRRIHSARVPAPAFAASALRMRSTPSAYQLLEDHGDEMTVRRQHSLKIGQVFISIYPPGHR